MYNAYRARNEAHSFESIHLLKAFSALYNKTVISHYLSVTYLREQATGFAKMVALRSVAGIIQEPLQAFLSKNKGNIVFYEELRDKTVKGFSTQYKFIVKASQVEALAGYIVSASMAMTYYMPRVDVGPICYAFGKFTGLGGIASSIGTFFDSIEDKQAKAYMASTIKNVTRSVLSIALQAKLASYFTVVISATLVSNPIAACVIATLLSAIVTATVINIMLYNENILFFGDVKNVLYTSPVEELETLIESHTNYLQNKELNSERKAELTGELEIWKEELKTFQQLEGLVILAESKMKELDEQGVKKNSAKMKQAKQALKNAQKNLQKHEDAYFHEKQKDALASRMIPDFLMNVIASTIPGFYCKMIFSTEIRSLFNTALTFHPSEMYNISKDQIMNSYFMATGLIPTLTKVLSGSGAPGEINIVETILNNQQIITAINTFVNNSLFNILKREDVQSYVGDRLTALQNYLENNGGKCGKSVSYVITKISDSVQEVLGLKVAEEIDASATGAELQ